MAEWRVGRTLGKTIYVDDRVVGYIEDVALAAEIVETMNRVGRLLAEVRETEWAGPGDALCELYAGHCPGCACVLPAGHPGGCDIHCGQPQRPQDAERRSEATPQNDLVVCEACGAAVALDGPFHEGGRLMPHKVTHETRPERWCHASRQVPLSIALGASRVDPYDTTKGGVTE